MHGKNYGSINEELVRIILVERDSITITRYIGYEENQ